MLGGSICNDELLFTASVANPLSCPPQVSAYVKLPSAVGVMSALPLIDETGQRARLHTGPIFGVGAGGIPDNRCGALLRGQRKGIENRPVEGCRVAGRHRCGVEGDLNRRGKGGSVSAILKTTGKPIAVVWMP